ncbi:MAG TPA: hypothetical protein VD794_16200 [Flavisolibacter sp.]|nr:hypothetical protein [Flavisolibacter sp.]
MKSRSYIFPLLVVNILLAIAVVSLYQQNRSYKSINRELIIKNDSILSVNLELLNARPLAQEQLATPKKKKTNRRS